MTPAILLLGALACVLFKPFRVLGKIVLFFFAVVLVTFIAFLHFWHP